MSETAIAERTQTQPLYALLAGAIAAYHNCKRSNNLEWLNRHADRVEQMSKDVLPRGSGVDSGCTIDLDECHADKIVIHTSFHHMNDGGMYDGWTEHAVTVTPSFVGSMNLKISGRDRNGIKDYLADLFHTALTESISETYDAETDKYSYRF